MGHSNVYLYTNEKMVENISLYAKVGYVEYERRDEEGFRRVFMWTIKRGTQPLSGDPMNANLVLQMARATLAGDLPFPEIVGHLIAEGVEYYRVDYVGRQLSFYGATGCLVVAPLTYEDLPAVAADFDGPALRAAILDSQQHGQSFRRFSHRAVQAGVAGYYAFLRGQRVTYLGRQGEQHTEWFPGARPERVPEQPSPA